MFCTYKLIVLGLHLTTLVYRARSFVLLTANVEDLKRIAQKFVSDSVADKIAQFIIEAADNKVEFDNSNVTQNLSEYNDEFDVEKKDIKAEYVGEFRQKPETKTKQELKPIKIRPAPKTKPKTEDVHKDNKKINNTKKQTKNKSKAKKANKITAEQSSLEFYRSEKQQDKLNANSIINLGKIHESDDSSNVKSSRKEFEIFDYLDKSDETQGKTDKLDSEVHKYIENDVSDTKAKKDASENESDISNRLDMRSEELSTVKANLTTAIEHNEFDQYFNMNYPKSDVVATSGPVELPKSNKTESSDTDYE